MDIFPCIPQDLTKARRIWPGIPETIPPPPDDVGFINAECSVCKCAVWSPKDTLGKTPTCMVCEYELVKVRSEVEGTKMPDVLGDTLESTGVLLDLADPERNDLADPVSSLGKLRRKIMNMTPAERLRSLPAPQLSTDGNDLRKSLLLLEGDLQAEGWNNPARLYAMVGDPKDPRFELMLPIPAKDHPAEIIEKLVSQQRHCKPDVLGLVIAHEAWATKPVSELDEEILELLREAVGEDRADVEDAWETTVSMLPEELVEQFRDEVRTVYSVMRDGSGVVCVRDRKSSKVKYETKNVTSVAISRISSAMWKLLTGGSDDDLAEIGWKALQQP